MATVHHNTSLDSHHHTLVKPFVPEPIQSGSTLVSLSNEATIYRDEFSARFVTVTLHFETDRPNNSD